MKIRNIILITVSICLLVAGGVYSARTDYFGSANITTATIGTANTTTENVTTSNIASGNITTGVVTTLTATNSTLYNIVATVYGRWKNIYYPSTSDSITSHSDPSQVGSIAWCVNELQPDGGTIIIPPKNDDYTFNSDYIIPSNVLIKPMFGVGKLAPAVGTTLTVNNIDAGAYQVFKVTPAGAYSLVIRAPALHTAWVNGDAGQKIMTLMNAVPTDTGSTIYVTPADWVDQTYSTPIVIDRDIVLQFPARGTSPAHYTGTGASIHIDQGANGSKIYNLHVDHVGNSNDDVDGIFLHQATDIAFYDSRVASTRRHGIVIDSDQVGAYQNHFDGVTRISNPGQSGAGHGIYIVNSYGSGSEANANHFQHVVGNGTVQAGSAWIFIDDPPGYSNVFQNCTLNGNTNGGYGIWTKGGEEFFGDVHFDMTNGMIPVKTEGGHLYIKSRKQSVGTGIADDDLAEPDQLLYCDVNVHNQWSFLAVKGNQDAYWTGSSAVIFGSSRNDSAPSEPFDVNHNLVIQANSTVGDPKKIFFAGGDPPKKWAEFSTAGHFRVHELIRFDYETATAATTTTLGSSSTSLGNFVKIAGTTTIADLTPILSGTMVILKFESGPITVKDVSTGGNFQLAGGIDKAFGANDTLTVICDGITWFEVSRSDN